MRFEHLSNQRGNLLVEVIAAVMVATLVGISVADIYRNTLDTTRSVNAVSLQAVSSSMLLRQLAQDLDQATYAEIDQSVQGPGEPANKLSLTWNSINPSGTVYTAVYYVKLGANTDQLVREYTVSQVGSSTLFVMQGLKPVTGPGSGITFAPLEGTQSCVQYPCVLTSRTVEVDLTLLWEGKSTAQTLYLSWNGGYS